MQKILLLVTTLFITIPLLAGTNPETVLHRFIALPSGATPVAGLIADAAGNLYGTSSKGGSSDFGTVFELKKTPNGWTRAILHNFANGLVGTVLGTDGNYPAASLIFDSSGNLYGTTPDGGVNGFGTVFELTPSAKGEWKETILYSFNDGSDGGTPSGGLIMDSSGNLYGVTAYGGISGSTCAGFLYCGVVYELSPATHGAWTFQVIYSFLGNSDGSQPVGNLILDSKGNLYGTTTYGGDTSCLEGQGCGTVYELTPGSNGAWSKTILYEFNGLTDQSMDPLAGLIFDSAGNLYGTTTESAFELSPGSGGSWNFTLLHSLNDVTEGYAIQSGLIFDSAGNLYGTAYFGGSGTLCVSTTQACGLVFELSRANGWAETTLYSFTGGTDGSYPASTLFMDPSGHLYGTATAGGYFTSLQGYGTVFELSNVSGQWQETVLDNFPSTDGADPVAGLVADSAGNLYGTTAYGEQGGTVFKLTPSANGNYTEAILHSFRVNDSDGMRPMGSLVLDQAGNLYGTTASGGGPCPTETYGCGTVFELSPPSNGQAEWTETILYRFKGRNIDGFQPVAGLVFDQSGNLYGTTSGGVGSQPCNGPGRAFGCGTVFELSPPSSGGSWTEKILYAFGNYPDANDPEAALIFDSAGNLYGTTPQGGTSVNCANGFGSFIGCGAVFQLVQSNGSWTEKVIHNFTDGDDGSVPKGSLTFDGAGNLYGTTELGGLVTCVTAASAGCGAVFELSPAPNGGWRESTLYDFCKDSFCADGDNPAAGVTFDSAGNLYGTTSAGAPTSGYCFPAGCGTVFKLTYSAGSWTESVVYVFDDTTGDGPVSNLIFGSNGNLLGTAANGGTYSQPFQNLSGVVFEVVP